jgi:hypothetical protein
MNPASANPKEFNRYATKKQGNNIKKNMLESMKSPNTDVMTNKNVWKNLTNDIRGI